MRSAVRVSLLAAVGVLSLASVYQLGRDSRAAAGGVDVDAARAAEGLGLLAPSPRGPVGASGRADDAGFWEPPATIAPPDRTAPASGGEPVRDADPPDALLVSLEPLGALHEASERAEADPAGATLVEARESSPLDVLAPLDAERSRDAGADQRAADLAAAAAAATPADTGAAALELIESAGDARARVDAAAALASAAQVEVGARVPPAAAPFGAGLGRRGGRRLDVRASESGVALERVEVVRGSALARPDLPTPGAYTIGELVYLAAGSPLELPAPIVGADVFYVRSPGRAWGRLVVGPESPPELVLELVPGGSLALELGAASAQAAFLRLREAGRMVYERCAAGEGSLELHSLAPGRYDVALEREEGGVPRVLAAGTVVVRAGDVAALALAPPADAARALAEVPGALAEAAGALADSGALAEAAGPRPAAASGPRLFGTLVLPHAWGVAPRLVARTGAGASGEHELTLVPVGGRPDEHAFEEVGLPAGSYELALADPLWTERVELGAERDARVHVVVPPPVALSVRALDATDGGAADIQWIHWTPVRAGRAGATVASVGRAGERGLFELRVPRGEVELSAWADGWERAVQRVDTGDGPARVTLRLERSCGIALALVDNDVRVPWSVDWVVRVEPLEGSGRVTSQAFDRRGCTLTVSAAGHYRVELAGVPGVEGAIEGDVVVRPRAYTALELAAR